jgi:hypothetical protein
MWFEQYDLHLIQELQKFKLFQQKRQQSSAFNSNKSKNRRSSSGSRGVGGLFSDFLGSSSSSSAGKEGTNMEAGETQTPLPTLPATGSNKIVDKLVPVRNTEEDNGYNTTLGMLNTF